MNYFKLLKLKEEELELLKKKLERITLEYRKSLQSKLDMLDLCNKERENLYEFLFRTSTYFIFYFLIYY